MSEKIAQNRIIHTVTNDLNFDQRMQRICTSLTQAGYECLLVGREKRDSKPLVAQIFGQKRLFCFFEKGPFFYVEFNIRLSFFLLKTKFNCVNAIDVDTIFAAWLISKIKSKKRIFDAHEYFHEVPEVTNRKWVKFFWKKLADFLVPKFDAAYTVGESLAEIFSKMYQIPFETVRNVPISRDDATMQREDDFDSKNSSRRGVVARNKIGARDKIVLYQGALNADRGLEEAILAMKMVDERAVLWLAGEGDLSKKLREIVAENGLQTRVKFLGFVLPNELKNSTSEAFIGLNLLKMNGLSYYFSLANKFFDYIQFGVPSLNMNFPEYQKIIAKHPVGLLLETCEPTEIAAAINGLILDEKRYFQLQKNAKIAAEIFRWERESVKLVQIYDEVLRKNPIKFEPNSTNSRTH